MIEDLDAELTEINADGIVIVGSFDAATNPSMVYSCGFCNIPSGGCYVKKVDSDPLLVVNDTDVDNAKQGLVKDIRTYSQYSYQALIKEHGRAKALPLLLTRILSETGMKKNVVLSGTLNAGNAIAIIHGLEQQGFELIADPFIVDRVRRIKSPRELDFIAEVAKRTESVVHDTLDMLHNCPVSGETVQHGNRALTVADVKIFINRKLIEANLDSTGAVIFAPGPDGAGGHNPGSPDRKIKTGDPIVFDIFPQDITTGYCFDTTRTFVLGRASLPIKKMHEDVLVAQQAVLDQVKEGANGQALTRVACEMLEKRGHKTLLYYSKHPGQPMVEGMNHMLGHGVGLAVGELPILNLFEDHTLEKGDVFTIEPGVYYPGKWGIRIEDTVALAGGLHNFSTLDKSLEL